MTPENNAAILVLKAMGPGEIGTNDRDEYCRMLGIGPLPEKGDYYVTLGKYAKASQDAGRPVTGEEKVQAIYWEQQAQAMKRPWSKKEFPVLAGWLAANEKPLVLLVAASKRPRRYDPLISGDGSAIAILLPALNQYREAARALSARAMLYVDEGQVDAAWQDLLACHRLARLAGQGPTLMEALVGIIVDGMACAGDQGLLQARLTPAQIAGMRADLDKLSPLPKMLDKINVAEQCMYLDCVGMVARKGFGAMAEITGGASKPKSTFESLFDSALTATVDWDQVLRMGNTWYDRMANAFAKPTRAERQRALSKIDRDIRKLSGGLKDMKSLGLSMLDGPRQAISERIGQVFVSLLLPAISMVSTAGHCGTMKFDLTRLAFALAAHHADHGMYPAKLADLVPKYAAEIPKDTFAVADLHYKIEDGGYLLYSVGRNGKDDGGKGMDDRKEGGDWDDIVVRVRAATERKR